MDKMRDLADFEAQIGSMSDRQLSEFTARQVYGLCETCERHTDQIATLQKTDRQSFGKAGSIGGAIVAVIGGIILFVLEGLKR